MAIIAVWLKLEEGRVAEGLQESLEKLDSADGELLLDFSAVRRLDARALAALQKLADAAELKQLKLALRGANIEIYKVIKLARLAPRFSFAA